MSEGPDSFAEESPNASVMILGEDSVEQAVVKITARPVVEGNNLVYPEWH